MNEDIRNLWYRERGKRLFDSAFSAIALIILSPIMSLISIAGLLLMGWPVFFVQQRPGRNGRQFNIIKYRTMNEGISKSGLLLPDYMRLTRFGRFLRRASLDELPELINVLRGDMSLVGPRPLLMDYLDRFTQEQARRMDVKPGVTGWAQINGRNAIEWNEKFELDVWYVDHVSFWLDLKILCLTPQKVFMKEGISYDGHATMPGFQGSKKLKLEGPSCK
jgi:sugar transferase EpsL